jgi:hypothetical protein
MDSRKNGGSNLSKTGMQLFLALTSLGLFAVVILFVQATFSAETNTSQKHAFDSVLKTDVSTTLAVLRASQGLLASLTSATLMESFELLQWSLSDRSDGLWYLSLLALSPTTGRFVLDRRYPWGPEGIRGHRGPRGQACRRS